MKEKKWKRNCPDCGKEIFHTEKWVRNKFIKLNKLCIKCNQKGNRSSHFGKRLSEETKRKISFSLKGAKSYWFGKRLSEETIEKIRKSKIGKKMPENVKRILMESNKGNQYRRGIKHSNEVKLKIKNSQLNHPNKIKINIKKRLSAIKRIKNVCGCIFPNFNRKSCEYFQWLNMQNGWRGQYAVNGGEYFIKDLGYWVDYYEPKENIIIEWDEKHHYNAGGQLKKKDFDRMLEIRNHLKCRFIRINDKTNEIKEYHE
jgi:hypothetical protein